MTMRLAVAACLLLASCQPPMRVTHVLTGRGGEPNAGDVHVRMETEPLPARFREVAIVHVVTYEREATHAHVVDALRRRAAALGCNALVRVHLDQGRHAASGNGVCGVVDSDATAYQGLRPTLP